MLENLVIGVISGFIASMLFVLFLYRLRPKILISSEIAKELQSNGQFFYTFKIVNETPYPVIDFKLELIILTPTNLPNGTGSHAKIISSLERFELESGKNPSPDFDNELFFTFPAALEDVWDDTSQQLLLVVIAKHSLSQFSRVTKQRFFRRDASIKVGRFPTGESLYVVANG